MSKHLLLTLKGILIGFASLGVPGLSASTIAIVLFVYYDMIYAISHIFSKPKKSLTFLAFLLLGYSIGCLGGAWMVNTLYIRYPIPVIAAVLGFLIGSIPRMAAESKEDFKRWPNWVVMITVAAIFLVYALVITGDSTVTFDKPLGPMDFIMMAMVGAITSTTLVIPGVDFAVTLMALGYYYAFIGLVGDLGALFASPARLFLLLFYLVGYGLGSVLFSKGLRYLIKRFPRQLHCVNFAMVAISPIIVIKKCIIENPNEKTFLSNISWKAWMWAFIMFAAGYFAFTWVPILLRYFGIVPKDPDKEAVETAAAARGEGLSAPAEPAPKHRIEDDEGVPDGAETGHHEALLEPGVDAVDSTEI
jgi:putative membrane protein